MLNLRSINQGVDQQREEVFQQYREMSNANPGNRYSGFRLKSMEDYETLRRLNAARSKTMSRFTRQYALSNVREQSNGESALQTLCVVLITLILSYFSLVFGELVPKRIAMKEPEKVARAVCGVTGAAAKFFKPIVWLLTKSVNFVLRLFGIDPFDTEEEVTEDEIRMLVDMGEEKGAIG